MIKILILCVLTLLLTGCTSFFMRSEDLWFKALPWADCPYCEHNRHPDYSYSKHEDMGDGYTKITRTYQWVDMRRNE